MSSRPLTGIALVMTFGVVGMLQPVGAAPKAKAFPDGAWTGRAPISGGISKDGFKTRGSGKLTFTVVIQKGSATFGSLHYDIRQRTTIDASNATGTVRYGGELGIRGTSGKLVADGELTYTVNGSVNGVPIPTTSGTMPASTSFTPSSVTCTRVTGDLAADVRPTQRAGGFASDVTAPFIAIRVPDLEKDFPPQIEVDYTRINAELAKAAAGTPSPEELLRLVKEAGELVSQIIGAAACGGPPPDFKKGVAGFLFADLFYQILLKVAGELPGTYTAQELIAMLGVGIRAGVIGGAASDPASARSLQSLFESALTAELRTAVANGDRQTILDIAVAAQQAGMTKLAADARKAL